MADSGPPAFDLCPMATSSSTDSQQPMIGPHEQRQSPGNGVRVCVKWNGAREKSSKIYSSGKKKRSMGRIPEGIGKLLLE